MSTKTQSEGLFISNEELRKLDDIIGNVPTKFGLPIVQFFQLIGQKRQAEENQSTQKSIDADDVTGF